MIYLWVWDVGVIIQGELEVLGGFEEVQGESNHHTDLYTLNNIGRYVKIFLKSSWKLAISARFLLMSVQMEHKDFKAELLS